MRKRSDPWRHWVTILVALIGAAAMITAAGMPAILPSIYSLKPSSESDSKKVEQRSSSIQGKDIVPPPDPRNARLEDARNRHDSAKNGNTESSLKPDEKSSHVPRAENLTTMLPSAFQPRSSPTDTLKVGHGTVEVMAKVVQENVVVITIVGRDFGNDLSPLQKWLGTTEDLFRRKLTQLGVASGMWGLVSDSRAFTVRDGMATLEITFQRK